MAQELLRTDVPNMMVELTSGTQARIYFEPAHLDPSHTRYEGPMSALRIKSGGAIVVGLERIYDGWLEVTCNPMRTTSENIRSAAQKVVLTFAETAYPKGSFKGIVG